MTVSLVDVDAFTSPVVAAADGEAATSASLIQGLQPLANRTHHLNLRTLGVGAAWGRFGLSGTVLLIDEKLTITALTTAGDLTVAGGNEVNFGSAGLYLVNFHVALQYGQTGNPIIGGVYLDVSGSVYQRAIANRFSNNVNDIIYVSGSNVVNATAGQRLSLKVSHSLTSGTGVGDTTASGLSIVRIK